MGKHSALVFVDLKDKKTTDRPDFYILNSKDWLAFVKRRKKAYEKSNPGKTVSIVDNILIYNDQLKKSGKPFEGTSVFVNDVSEYKNKWKKIRKIIKEN